MKVPDIADAPCVFRDASEGLSAKMQLRVYISQVRYPSRELAAAVPWGVGAKNISLGEARMRPPAVSDLRELVEEQLVAEIKRYRR